MDIVKQLRMYPYEYARMAADEIENLRREAHTWSKACEAATTKIHKLRMHPRIEVRYWDGDRWGPLCGPQFDAALESLDDAVDTKPRFENVSCSQCGRDFGPGDHGFSHCENHK